MKRLKVGIVGCGAVAQIQHLPHLRELSGEFEIAGLCDLSPKLLAELGGEYGVPPERRFLDHQDLVQSDVDAVIVCPTGSHAAPSIAAGPESTSWSRSRCAPRWPRPRRWSPPPTRPELS